MSVMQKRCRTDSVLTLQAVNSYLDQLAKSIDNQQKKNILSELFHESTLEEQKWLARIILKDLKIGLGHETVLKNYHPDAVDLYNITSDLKEVFRDLSGNDKRMGADRFRIFFPIRPMLADKMPLKQLAVILEKNKVLIETKFDGERIQCHFKDDVVKFFSRNSNNYTHIYGPKMAPIIRENVNAKSVILGTNIDFQYIRWRNGCLGYNYKQYGSFWAKQTSCLGRRRSSRETIML
jgi:DNA ligase 4